MGEIAIDIDALYERIKNLEIENKRLRNAVSNRNQMTVLSIEATDRIREKHQSDFDRVFCKYRALEDLSSIVRNGLFGKRRRFQTLENGQERIEYVTRSLSSLSREEYELYDFVMANTVEYLLTEFEKSPFINKKGEHQNET